MRGIKEDNEATIRYDKGRIKTLMHDNDMAKRQNKELEDKMSILQEKLNEHLSSIYKYEVQIEKWQLDMDAFNTEKQGVLKERDHFKIE